jgi:hypothetical protein
MPTNERSDAELREEVIERLAQDLRVDGRDLDIEVSAGTVILRGTVPEPGQQEVVEADARQVPGVRAVENHLRLAETETGPFEGDILPANTFDASQIKVDMPVVGVDGTPVGRVKAVGDEDFLVDRPLARDVYVPFSYVLNATNEWEDVRGGPVQPTAVVLTIASSEVDDQHWRTA